MKHEFVRPSARISIGGLEDSIGRYSPSISRARSYHATNYYDRWAMVHYRILRREARIIVHNSGMEWKAGCQQCLFDVSFVAAMQRGHSQSSVNHQLLILIVVKCVQKNDPTI